MAKKKVAKKATTSRRSPKADKRLVSSLNRDVVPIDSLEEWADNPNSHGPESLRRIRESVRQFGQIEPLVVKGQTVFGGNGRLTILREEGFAQVDVVRVDHLSDAEAVALGITLNRSAEASRWKLDKLNDHLQALGDDFQKKSGLLDADLKKIREQEIAEELRGIVQNQKKAADESDDTPADDASPQPGDDGFSSQTEAGTVYRDLNLVLTTEQDETVRDAIKKAKERPDVETSPEALAVICREWMETA